MKNKLFIYGVINTILLYIMHTVFSLGNSILEYYLSNSAYCIIFFLFLNMVYYIINIVMYIIFYKSISIVGLKKWGYILGGNILTSIIISVLWWFLVEWTESIVLPQLIPYRINTIYGFIYLFFILVYTLFVYELSEKLYILLNTKLQNRFIK